MPLIQDTDLYMMVGEIRSDVKKLLENSGDHAARITSLERWRWVAHGAMLVVMLGVPTAVARAFGYF